MTYADVDLQVGAQCGVVGVNKDVVQDIIDVVEDVADVVEDVVDVVEDVVFQSGFALLAPPPGAHWR